MNFCHCITLGVFVYMCLYKFGVLPQKRASQLTDLFLQLHSILKLCCSESNGCACVCVNRSTLERNAVCTCTHHNTVDNTIDILDWSPQHNHKANEKNSVWRYSWDRWEGDDPFKDWKYFFICNLNQGRERVLVWDGSFLGISSSISHIDKLLTILPLSRMEKKSNVRC